MAQLLPSSNQTGELQFRAQFLQGFREIFTEQAKQSREHQSNGSHLETTRELMQNWSSQAKKVRRWYTSAGHIGQKGRQVNQFGPTSSPQPTHRQTVVAREYGQGGGFVTGWIGGSVDWPTDSEDALTRCPVFGSRGNRRILFRILSSPESWSQWPTQSVDQSMTTPQQHQLVQNQVSKVVQLSIHGSGWFYSGHSGFHPLFLNRKESKKRPHWSKRENEKEKRFLNILNFNPSEYKLPSFQIWKKKIKQFLLPTIISNVKLEQAYQLDILLKTQGEKN